MMESLRGFEMKFDDYNLTVYEAQAMFGLSKSAFDDWFNKGEMLGVKHPSADVHKGGDVTGARRYSEEDTQRAMVELDKKGFAPVRKDMWKTDDLMQHGTMAFMSQCVREGEARIGNYLFSVTSELPSITIKVRDFLPHKRSLAKAVGMTLVTRSFPKIGFKVTEVKENG